MLCVANLKRVLANDAVIVPRDDGKGQLVLQEGKGQNTVMSITVVAGGTSCGRTSARAGRPALRRTTGVRGARRSRDRNGYAPNAISYMPEHRPLRWRGPSLRLAARVR